MDWTSLCMALWLNCQDPACNPANCETYTLNSCELYYPTTEPEPEPTCKGGPKQCGGDSGGGGKDNPNKGGGKKNG